VALAVGKVNLFKTGKDQLKNILGIFDTEASKDLNKFTSLPENA
jgi:hypothetical protein